MALGQGDFSPLVPFHRMLLFTVCHFEILFLAIYVDFYLYFFNYYSAKILMAMNCTLLKEMAPSAGDLHARRWILP